MIEITVTDNDISLAQSLCSAIPGRNSEYCPIGCALKRHRMFEHYVDVSINHIQVDNTIYWIPQECKNFISRFDDGKKVYPFSFILK